MLNCDTNLFFVIFFALYRLASHLQLKKKSEQEDENGREEQLAKSENRCSRKHERRQVGWVISQPRWHKFFSGIFTPQKICFLEKSHS